MNPMQKTLERFLAPEQIRYLVWALKKEKSIYFYGEQGTGKSYLQHLLHDFGGLDVHEPGEEDFKALFASGEIRQIASVEKRQFGSAEIRQFESIEKSQS